MSAGRLSVWPPLPPAAWLARPASDLPFPLPETGCRLFSRARNALRHGLGALPLEAGDEVLAPAYHHGSEIEAIAGAGLVTAFYEATETLVPDEAELEALVTPRTRALCLVHYLGFPQDARRWREWADARELVLIEDAAQAWLATADGRPVGSFGDLSIFCLYKTIGLPDGAALVTAAGNGVELPRQLGLGGVARRHGAWLAGRSRVVARLAAARSRAREYVPAADFALAEAAAPSTATLRLLPRLAGADRAAERRDRYRMLLRELEDVVPPPFSDLPSGASPFVFPITVPGKRTVLERLRRNGIQALDFWSAPHPSLPRERFPAAAARRERLVGLPVHQELRARDVERIVRAVRQAIRT